MNIVKGAELTNQTTDIFPTSWYIEVDADHIVGPFATEAQAAETANDPSAFLTMDALDAFLNS